MSAQALQWFRLYHRIVDDEKVRLLAFEDRWHFISLCCLKCSGLLDEPESDVKWRKVALKMGIQARELDEVKRRLFDVGLVDENMAPVAWDDLQFKSDTSTDRVREYREKSRSSKTKQPRNVSVTGQETDTELEAEKKSKEKEKSTISPKKPINENWSLPGDLLASTQAAYPGVTLAAILAEAPRFRDHYLASGAEYSDWDAKWRNWCRNAFPGKEVSKAEAQAAEKAMIGRVRLHMDTPEFRQIVSARGGKHPPTDRDGCWTFPESEVEDARVALREQAA